MAGIKLILTDIDGTILPYGARVVPERTRAAFHRALEAGICIGPATGRGFGWLPPLFAGERELCSTTVATNGNEVYLEGRQLRKARMGAEALGAVARLVREVEGAGLICFEGDTPLLVEGSRDDLARVMPGYAKTCVEAGRLPEGPAVKANVFLAGGLAEDEGLARTHALAERLDAAVAPLDFDVPQPGFINLMPDGWSKATGIDTLVEAMGISLEEVVVFGDGGNDVSMLAHVPYSVAVADAAPDAREAARWHIGPCHEESVAQAIEAIAEGDFPLAGDVPKDRRACSTRSARAQRERAQWQAAKPPDASSGCARRQ